MVAAWGTGNARAVPQRGRSGAWRWDRQGEKVPPCCFSQNFGRIRRRQGRARLTRCRCRRGRAATARCIRPIICDGTMLLHITVSYHWSRHTNRRARRNGGSRRRPRGPRAAATVCRAKPCSPSAKVLDGSRSHAMIRTSSWCDGTHVRRERDGMDHAGFPRNLSVWRSNRLRQHGRRSRDFQSDERLGRPGALAHDP